MDDPKPVLTLSQAAAIVQTMDPADMPMPRFIEYDLETHILGQRYLCIRKTDSAGFSTIPVAG